MSGIALETPVFQSNASLDFRRLFRPQGTQIVSELADVGPQDVRVAQRNDPPTLRVVSERPPEWLAPAVSRISHLYSSAAAGRQAFDLEDVVAAITFLAKNMKPGVPVLWIGRLDSGGVELAWKSGDVEVEVVF